MDEEKSAPTRSTIKVLSSVFVICSFCIAGKRLTPCQAAMHPFLAPEFPCTYLLPWKGGKISGIDVVGIVFYILFQEDNRGAGGGYYKERNWQNCSEFTKLMFQKNDCFQSSMCYSKNSHVRAQWFTNLLIILIPQQKYESV